MLARYKFHLKFEIPLILKTPSFQRCIAANDYNIYFLVAVNELLTFSCPFFNIRLFSFYFYFPLF